MQEINYNMSNMENSTRKNFNASALKNNNYPTENIKMFNNIKLNTPMNANNNLNINNLNANLKVFNSSKTISTKNSNGKKFVFNEKQEYSNNLNNHTNNINQPYQELINQTGNNVNSKALNWNANGNLVEKPNNLNRFTKIGKENTSSIVQKSTEKIKNLFANKFA